MIKVEINGKEYEVEPGKNIIEVADDNSIAIPRFCYHKKLTVAANCRMCLVEVEKAPKPLPACATRVSDGMKVFTNSEKALKAQKSVMEFLLINHPLDCPICDQGGECELQDLSMGYGRDVSRFTEGKRSVHDLDIGPLVKTEMTRCIHCTRCVRFGEEIAGVRELGATGRGEHTTIGTYLEKNLDSELSGNVIDVCPVGALTSKPFRHTARPWELTQKATIAPHDCVGSNVYVHTLRNEVMRIIPKDNPGVNECWISDRDRFSYTALNSNKRLLNPQYKTNGQWQSISWDEAFEILVKKVTHIKEHHGAEQMGALVSPSATVEEGYILQKLLKALGSLNIDHRIHQIDFSHQESAAPSLGRSIQSLEDLDGALLLGANPRKEQPMINHRLRKASLKGAQISYISGVKQDINYAVAEYLTVERGDFIQPLAQIASALISLAASDDNAELTQLLSDVKVSQSAKNIAKQLSQGTQTAILLGTQVTHHKNYGLIREIAKFIAELSGATFGVLTDGANATGLWHAECLPFRSYHAEHGKNAAQMLNEPLKAYILHGIEPDIDCANTQKLSMVLKEAELVVALTGFQNDYLAEHADIILPLALFAENEGTFVNIEGRWQSFEQACQPKGEAKPAWKIYRVLAKLMKLSGFDYQSVQDVLVELKASHAFNNEPVQLHPSSDRTQIKKIFSLGLKHYNEQKEQVAVITQWPCYAIDAIVRHSEPLQRTSDAIEIGVYVNSDTAVVLGVNADDSIQLTDKDAILMPKLRLVIDERIPDNSVFIPKGILGEMRLPASGEAITLTKMQVNNRT